MPFVYGQRGMPRFIAFGMPLSADGNLSLDSFKTLIDMNARIATGSSPEDAPVSTTHEAFSAMKSVLGMCAGRSFAITEKGFYCLVPRVSRPGDKCCVLRGLGVPFIIRESWKNGDLARKLLGESYIHGLMHGEAIHMVSKGELEEKVIVLS
ncbi:hypothetical protein B0H67DRAFT_316383 [Lasiosphaeris hirsuta]|uniref:Uncharacterized protein n=1 Tax=Lasiosphaeris hirsuta TaxID=260670 RepID=A0AA40DKZ9_9PEZI|nr:hypothetical protein B0H67DRAFT_316383 [Lasiosphaeris hirsuta]